MYNACGECCVGFERVRTWPLSSGSLQLSSFSKTLKGSGCSYELHQSIYQSIDRSMYIYVPILILYMYVCIIYVYIHLCTYTICTI